MTDNEDSAIGPVHSRRLILHPNGRMCPNAADVTTLGEKRPAYICGCTPAQLAEEPPAPLELLDPTAAEEGGSAVLSRTLDVARGDRVSMGMEFDVTGSPNRAYLSTLPMSRLDVVVDWDLKSAHADMIKDRINDALGLQGGPVQLEWDGRCTTCGRTDADCREAGCGQRTAPGGETDLPPEVEFEGDRGGREPAPLVGDGPSAHQKVRADTLARMKWGIEKYGTPLRPNNGRNPTQDGYEEALDLAAYLAQMLMEEATTVDNLAWLLDLVMSAQSTVQRDLEAFSEEDFARIRQLALWAKARARGR